MHAQELALNKNARVWRWTRYQQTAALKFLNIKVVVPLISSHERQNELILKTSSVQMKFHFSCISKRPDILMDLCRHFISGSVGIFYHPKWNFVSVKMTEMKSISALSFKRTCALNATKSLRLFISFRVNYVHMKIQCRFDISFRSNWPVWKLYLFEF